MSKQSKEAALELAEIPGLRGSDSSLSPGHERDEVKNGTLQDEADMYRLGKKQQLNVRSAFHTCIFSEPPID